MSRWGRGKTQGRETSEQVTALIQVEDAGGLHSGSQRVAGATTDKNCGRGGAGPRQARAARARGRSVRDPRASLGVPARASARWGQAAAGRPQAEGSRAAEDPLLPRPRRRSPAAASWASREDWELPEGRRRRQPGSPDVAAPRGGAADALLGPGRRLVLKGQRPVRGRGGAAFCPPCATPAPRGRCAAAPSPLFRAGRHRSAARPPPDGRRWPPRGQVFLWPEPWPVAPRGAWRRRPVIGRGRRECRTLSGRGRLCPCPPPSHGSKWVRSEGPGPPAPPARGSCPRWAHRGGRA
nr:uncharacterized protein LOC111775076 [Equus caballus]